MEPNALIFIFFAIYIHCIVYEMIINCVYEFSADFFPLFGITGCSVDVKSWLLRLRRVGLFRMLLLNICTCIAIARTYSKDTVVLNYPS
jgi:hypothetical protein